MLSRFAGKSAVITGAGSGLGKEIAKMGSKLGMNLVLVDLNADSLATVTNEINGSRLNLPPVTSVAADVSDHKQVAAVGAHAKQTVGVPNFVLNNAGIARSGLAWEYTPEEWKWFLGVNLMSVVNGINVFTPAMLAEAKANPDYRGRIVNTASMAGLCSMPISAMYNVSKHGVVTLTETLFYDLKFVTNQVSASVICPFFIPTNIGVPPTLPKDVADAYGTHRPPSQAIGEALTAKATASGRVSAEDVAGIVFDALDKEQFYIYSHAASLHGFKDRAEDILQGNNPRDPYAFRPEVGEKLKQMITHAYSREPKTKK